MHTFAMPIRMCTPTVDRKILKNMKNTTTKAPQHLGYYKKRKV